MNWLSLVVVVAMVVSWRFVPAPYDYTPGLISKTLPEREPARLDPAPDICFLQRLERPHILKEIAWAEKNSPTLPAEVRGDSAKIYQHFLMKSEGALHPSFAKPDSCQVVPCLYENVYGKQSVAKDIGYLFFLKTGAVLAGTNQVPESWRTDDKNEIKSWLFSEDELVLLGITALANEPPSAKIFPAGLLNRIFRMQRGYNFARDPLLCGLAYSTGFIQLLDNCLRTSQSPLAMDSGGFRRVLHEIGHQVDFGRSFTHEISVSPKWLGLNGWSRDDIFNRRLKIANKGWGYNPAKEKEFVTEYAKSSPSEDFAESLAHFRLQPKTLSAASPDKFKFISDHFYGSRNFIEKDYLSHLTDQMGAALLSRAEDAIRSCVSASPGPAPTVLAGLKEIPPSFAGCVEQNLREEAQRSLKQTVYNEPEACRLLGSNQAGKKQVEEVLVAHRDRLEQTMFTVLDLEKITAIRNDIQKTFDPRQIYLQLFGQKKMAELYTDALKKIFQDHKSRFQGLKSFNEKSEWELFVAKNSFTKTEQEVRQWIDDFIRTSQTHLMSGFDGLWRACLTNHKTIPNANLIAPLAPPSGAFVYGSFIHCLNRDVQNVSNQLTQENLNAFAKKVQSTVTASDRALSEVLRHFVGELGVGRLGDLLQTAVSEDQKYLVGFYAKNEANIKAWITAQRYLDLPLERQVPSCRDGVHQYVWKHLANSPVLKVVQYSDLLSIKEVEICQLMIEKDPQRLLALETLRRSFIQQVLKIVQTEAPKSFPLTGGFENHTLVKVDKGPCPAMVREMAVKRLGLAKFPVLLVDRGIQEICLNGRYAGRFTWQRSSRVEFFGGDKFLGTATFDSSPPTGAEQPYFLYAMKRFLALRSEESLGPQNEN